jgi:hypothetical protein
LPPSGATRSFFFEKTPVLSFLAMLLTFRLGLGAAPLDGAVASLRSESLAVAAHHAAEEAPVTVYSAEVLGSLTPPAPRPLTHRDWGRIVGDALQNESVANAAMWLASQPFRVNVTGEKFSVSVRVATP